MEIQGNGAPYVIIWMWYIDIKQLTIMKSSCRIIEYWLTTILMIDPAKNEKGIYLKTYIEKSPRVESQGEFNYCKHFY